MRSSTSAQRGGLLPRCILRPRLPHAGRAPPPLPTSHCLPTTSFLPTSPSLPRCPSGSAATGTALRSGLLLNLRRAGPRIGAATRPTPPCGEIARARAGGGRLPARSGVGEARRLGAAVQSRERVPAVVASRHGAVWVSHAAWALRCSRTSARRWWSPPGTMRCGRHTPVAADTLRRSRTSRPRRWPPPAIASLLPSPICAASLTCPRDGRPHPDRHALGLLALAYAAGATVGPI